MSFVSPKPKQRSAFLRTNVDGSNVSAAGIGGSIGASHLGTRSRATIMLPSSPPSPFSSPVRKRARWMQGTFVETNFTPQLMRHPHVTRTTLTPQPYQHSPTRQQAFHVSEYQSVMSPYHGGSPIEPRHPRPTPMKHAVYLPDQDAFLLPPGAKVIFGDVEQVEEQSARLHSLAPAASSGEHNQHTINIHRAPTSPQLPMQPVFVQMSPAQQFYPQPRMPTTQFDQFSLPALPSTPARAMPNYGQATQTPRQQIQSHPQYVHQHQHPQQHHHHHVLQQQQHEQQHAQQQHVQQPSTQQNTGRGYYAPHLAAPPTPTRPTVITQSMEYPQQMPMTPVHTYEAPQRSFSQVFPTQTPTRVVPSTSRYVPQLLEHIPQIPKLRCEEMGQPQPHAIRQSIAHVGMPVQHTVLPQTPLPTTQQQMAPQSNFFSNFNSNLSAAGSEVEERRISLGVSCMSHQQNNVEHQLNESAAVRSLSLDNEVITRQDSIGMGVGVGGIDVQPTFAPSHEAESMPAMATFGIQQDCPLALGEFGPARGTQSTVSMATQPAPALYTLRSLVTAVEEAQNNSLLMACLQGDRVKLIDWTEKQLAEFEKNNFDPREVKEFLATLRAGFSGSMPGNANANDGRQA